MASAQPWIFTQLGGDKLELQLTGWQAPFGRARQGTIVNAGLSIRHQKTYYASPLTPPTVHLFGEEPKPFEIHGRWMDFAIGITDGAKTFAKRWKDFVSDQQVVRAKWGNILSYQLVITDIDLDFESERDIAWALKGEVIVDEAATVAPTVQAVKTPSSIADQMLVQFTAANPKPPLAGTNILALLPEISDAIDTVVSTINAPFALVYNIATSISDFETALSTDLVKLGSGLQEVKTGLFAIRDTTDMMVSSMIALNQETLDLPNGIFTSTDQEQAIAAKIASDNAVRNFMALLSEMQNQIDRATRGTTDTTVQAQDGDTWESIATRMLGGPQGARSIKDMNGVRYGTKPVPGRVYHIPQSA
jgi:hypothetical protein